jgi:hypothetical protein
MSKEGGFFQSEIKKTKELHPRFYMFFPGATATYKSVDQIKTELANNFGPQNTIVYNSILSSEAPKPNRFEEMGELIQKKIKNKTPLTVIANCLGAVEFQTAIKTIEENTPGFFDNPDHIKNMKTVLISPSGFFKGKSGAMEYVRGLYYLARNEKNFPIISNLHSGIRGLISINTFLPDIHRETLIKGIRNAFSNYSQHKEDLPEVAFIPGRDYNIHLPKEIRIKMKKIDERLKKAITQTDNKAIKMLLSFRGMITRKELDKAYNGDYFSKQEAIPERKDRWTMGGFLKLGNVLKDMFQGKPMEKIKELKKNGMQVSFIVPEFDCLVPINEILKFFKEFPEAEKVPPIKQLPLEAHVASITTAQSKSIIEAIKTL